LCCARQSIVKAAPKNHRLISKGMLLPTSRFMMRWNGLLILLLAYTAILTPYEARAVARRRGSRGRLRRCIASQVAFLDSGREDIIWWFDRIVDFAFLVDICVNFNLCFYDEVLKRYHQSRRVVSIRCARRARQQRLAPG
jgi:hypothetical protein